MGTIFLFILIFLIDGEVKNSKPHILFCDEAAFTKDGIFNMHYSYGGDNPHIIKKTKHQEVFRKVFLAIICLDLFNCPIV